MAKGILGIIICPMLGDREEFEAALEELRKTSGLLERVPDEEWGSLQPTDDLYAECKAFLA